ncbi:MAG: hypothetical protein Q9209_002051 [Squamulea sp. 1 TL-2023]
MGLLSLPNELLLDIAHHLDRSDLKIIRIVCSRLAEFAAPFVFTTAICAARQGVFVAFQALSKRPQVSQHVRELVYDSSSFEHETVKLFEKSTAESQPPNAPSTPEGQQQYIEGYRQQEKLLESSLPSTLAKAVRRFSNLRRIIYSDFGRLPCFRWDRVEDLGPDFRLAHLHIPEAKNEACLRHPLVPHLEKDKSLRCSYLPLAVLLRELFRADCKAQVDDLRLGDNRISRGKGGIPDILFMSLFDGSYGPSTALFGSLRKLDVTFAYCTRRDHAEALPRFGRLELLRLVGPMCSPADSRFAPDLSEPVVRFPISGKDFFWPKLRALELKWVASSIMDFLTFLNRHKDTLQFVILHEMYLDATDEWRNLTSSLRAIYPNLIVEPYQTSIPYNHDGSPIIQFTLYYGQATLVNMEDPSHTNTNVNNYDEDETSNFHDDEESLSEEERWSSEELEYSEDGDTSDIEEPPVQHRQDCTSNPQANSTHANDTHTDEIIANENATNATMANESTTAEIGTETTTAMTGQTGNV